MTTRESLQLLREAKIRDLLPESALDVDEFEASGVLFARDRCWVIFDNIADVARMEPELSSGDENAVTHIRSMEATGFEDIAYDDIDDTYFLLVEAIERESGTYMAQVIELDGDLRLRSERWLDFPLDRQNKGIEGLTCVRRGDDAYLLGLCEGNLCESGEVGRRPGGGRVHVFALPSDADEQTNQWDRFDTIPLPRSLDFADFSSLSASGSRLAVLSQESSALWVGELTPSGWDLVDDGTIYAFPGDGDGTPYGNVEGVSWLTDNEVVVVSDRAKKDQPSRFKEKDESIHVFALPVGR